MQINAKRAARKEKYRKLGEALSALEQDWARRRGEAIDKEYRSKRSGYAGPQTLQLCDLYNRLSSGRAAQYDDPLWRPPRDIGTPQDSPEAVEAARAANP